MEMKELKYKRYPAYKVSGSKRIREIPTTWEISKLGRLLKPISIKNRPYLPLLSITRELGVIERDIENEDENHNYIPDDLTNYKLLEKGQFGMNKMKAWQGSYGVSNYTGIVSPAYYTFKFTEKINPRFFHIAIRSKTFVSFFGQASDGVRIGQWDLSKPRMKEIPFFLPPIGEQTTIATFLDNKTAKIDKAIAQKQKMIELLKERKQIIIQNAVTRGIDENGKIRQKPKCLPAEGWKNSGVEWIGEIPEGWEVKRLKFIAFINNKSLPENTSKNLEIDYVDIGSVSYANGIEKTERFSFKNSPSRARRIAYPGNTIISTVRTYLKAIDFVSEEKSSFIYSTGFAILQPKKVNDKFLYHFVRSSAFTEQVTVNSTGMSYPAINSTDIGRIWLTVPIREEQEKIVFYIETQSTKIDRAIALQQTQIEKLKEYKATLIDSSVTGKIKVS